MEYETCFISKFINIKKAAILIVIIKTAGFSPTIHNICRTNTYSIPFSFYKNFLKIIDQQKEILR